MSTSDTIWCSDFLNQTRLSKEIIHDYGYRDRPFVREATRRQNDGLPITPEQAPVRMAWMKKLDRPKRPVLGDVFKIRDRMAIVSERFKTLLEQFEIGETRFFEVPLWDDGVEVTDQRFFLLNLAETRNVGLPYKTEIAQKREGWWFIANIKGGPICVDPKAMDGLDLVYEPNFDSTVFFSDRLVKAIKAAKIKPLTLVKCVSDEGTP